MSVSGPRRLKLPASVKIGPYDYPIEIKEKVVGEQGQEWWGYWRNFPEQRIEIKRGTTDARCLAILLHECLHAIDDVVSIRLKERQANQLGQALAALLLDNDLLNPALFAEEMSGE